MLLCTPILFCGSLFLYLTGPLPIASIGKRKGDNIFQRHPRNCRPYIRLFSFFFFLLVLCRSHPLENVKGTTSFRDIYLRNCHPSIHVCAYVYHVMWMKIYTYSDRPHPTKAKRGNQNGLNDLGGPLETNLYDASLPCPIPKSSFFFFFFFFLHPQKYQTVTHIT